MGNICRFSMAVLLFMSASVFSMAMILPCHADAAEDEQVMLRIEQRHFTHPGVGKVKQIAFDMPVLILDGKAAAKYPRLAAAVDGLNKKFEQKILEDMQTILTDREYDPKTGTVDGGSQPYEYVLEDLTVDRADDRIVSVSAHFARSGLGSKREHESVLTVLRTADGQPVKNSDIVTDRTAFLKDLEKVLKKDDLSLEEARIDDETELDDLMLSVGREQVYVLIQLHRSHFMVYEIPFGSWTGRAVRD